MGKILVVDDERSIADVLAQRLRGEGYGVAAVYDGEAVWEQLGVFKPDLLVLDLMLPGGDGFSICKKYRYFP